jgi:hypothetical protein
MELPLDVIIPEVRRRLPEVRRRLTDWCSRHSRNRRLCELPAKEMSGAIRGPD